MSNRTQKHITGRHVFCWIAGFFGVIFSVNALMTVLALTTFQGMTNENAYVDGLAYNDTLAAIDAQKELGWDVQTDIRQPGDLQVGVRAEYHDAAGNAINRLDVSAEFVRPVAQGDDFIVPLSATAAGTYRAETRVPLPGQWDIRIVARKDGEPPYVLTRRSVIQ